jgi:hypothetical protein
MDYKASIPGVLISALAVTPSDSADLAPPDGNARPTRGLLVGGAGNVVVIMADGTSVTLTIPATACGLILPLAVMRIKATSTTATSIVAFY